MLSKCYAAILLNNTSGRYRQPIETLKMEMEFNKHVLSLYLHHVDRAVDLLSDLALFYQKVESYLRWHLKRNIKNRSGP